MTEANKSRIPDFQSYEEEAQWWDTHDLSEFWDELKPVEVRFAKSLSENLNIRLEPTDLVKLRTLAHKRGVGPTTLARIWIKEHL